LEYAAKNIIVSPGLASVCIPEDLDSTLAHAVYNAHTKTKHEGHHLHGAVVVYGLLLLLLVDGQEDEFRKVYDFCKAVNLPHRLADIGIDAAHPEELISKTLLERDLKVGPYQITGEMIRGAIEKLEGMYEG